MGNPLLNQVSNRNFMSPIGFKLKINKCPKVDFLATGCNLPGVTLGTAIQFQQFAPLEECTSSNGSYQTFNNNYHSFHHIAPYLFITAY